MISIMFWLKEIVGQRYRCVHLLYNTYLMFALTLYKPCLILV